MSVSPERREEMARYLQGSTKFHGEFRYPEECYPFAELAVREHTAMPPVDGFGYAIDLFSAKNRKAECPVHINIHGGGFVCPHQINDSLWSAWLADAIQGVVVDVDYTLSDRAEYPVALDQCRAVGRYVRAHCAEWDCDPRRISIGGYSAGGTLATGAAMWAGQNGECPYCLLVNGYGPVTMEYDPEVVKEDEFWLKPANRGIAFTELYTGGRPEVLNDPYCVQEKASDEVLAKLPRTVICTAATCGFRFEDEVFGHRLASLGVEVTMKRFPGTAHGFIPHFMDGWREAGELIARSIRTAGL